MTKTQFGVFIGHPGLRGGKRAGGAASEFVQVRRDLAPQREPVAAQIQASARPGWPRAASSASAATAGVWPCVVSHASASSRGGRRNSTRWQRLRIVADRRVGCALSSHR